MKNVGLYQVRLSLLLILATAACFAIALAGDSGRQALAADKADAHSASPYVTCPAGQCFADVTAANSFYANINALYMDGIISGYACGGPGEPCDASSRPYYRPNLTVSRQQMAKFVDLGRRNIADAIGLRLVLTNTTDPALVISTTIDEGIIVNTASNDAGLWATCSRANQNCYAIQGTATTGNRPAYLTGGTGTYMSSADTGYAGMEAHGNGATSYGGELWSNGYRAGYAKSISPSFIGMYIDSPQGATNPAAGLHVHAPAIIDGELTLNNGCTGCFLSNIVQNVDSTALEPGDVVSVVGSSAPVQGDIPLVTVTKASAQYDTGVLGIIGQVMYVPDQGTRSAYDQQEQAIRAAMEQRAQAGGESAGGLKIDPSSNRFPQATLTDAQGTIHAMPGAEHVDVNGYGSVVTQGVYKAIKVDAAFGAIKAGDLLTTSPHAGFAMKVTDKNAATGAIIGKALGSLDSGSGTIPVMVTLK